MQTLVCNFLGKIFALGRLIFSRFHSWWWLLQGFGIRLSLNYSNFYIPRTAKGFAFSRNKVLFRE